MTDTYADIMARLLPIYEIAPKRFMAFYNAVYLMCIDLPEGSQFRISDRCTDNNIGLFRDIVVICIIEQPCNACSGLLELSDDMEYVKRTTGFRPSGKRSFQKRL